MAEGLAEEFRKWVLDPARTNDELLPAVHLLHRGRVVWGWKHQQPKFGDFDERLAEAKRRRLNPALRPPIDPEDLAATVEVWAEVKRFANSMSSSDRPIRNLEALRFFPHLEEVSVEGAELPDLSLLAGLSGLRTLTLTETGLLGGYITTDLRPLAGLPIEKLNLSLRQPWLDFSVLTTLPQLRELTLRVNLIALENVPALPSVETAILEADFHCNTPVRSFRALPEMPRVQRLVVKSVASLEGVERLTELRNLDLAGTFSDLRPLAKLPAVTFLRLEGELFSEVAPLARMPALRELLFVRQVPFDLSPLAESASLREVRVERCDIIATELAAINAALNPDENDFLADPPRPLAPFRFISYQPQQEDVVKLRKEFPRQPEDDRRKFDYGADVAKGAAEARWGAAQIRARLDRLLGEEWTGELICLTAGHLQVTLSRYQDVMRFQDVVAALREFSASSRYPWNFMIVTEPHGDLSEEMDEREERGARRKKPGPWLVREFDAEETRREQEEWNESRREEYARLEAEHRLRLKEEQQAQVDPADFSPTPKPPADDASGTTAVRDKEENAGDDDGDLLEAEPDDQVEDELTEKLRTIVFLHENILWCTSHTRENAEYLFGESAEDWHNLPQPIQDRPRPENA